jgi:hypothetical protein
LGAENKIAVFVSLVEFAMALGEFATRGSRTLQSAPHRTHPFARHCNAPTPKATATVLDQHNVGQITRGLVKSLEPSPTFHP